MPPRLAAVVLPVGLLGLAVAAAAAVSFAVSPRDVATLAGIAGLLAASTLAERYPVPLDGIDTGGVSLGFVFCTAAIVLYGWEAGVIVGLAAPIMHMLEHRPPIRVAYNASVLAIAAVVAGAGDRAAPRRRTPRSSSRRSSSRRSRHFGVNLLLISLVVSVSARKPFVQRRPHERRDHEPAVRADGLGGADARDPLAALAVPLRARSSGRCSRSRSTSARPSASCGRCGSR